MTPYPLRLTSAGLTLAAYEAGNPAGPPLLFVHGNSLSSRSFQQQFAAPELQGFRLLALDWPGHGQSAPAPDHYAPAAMGALLRAAVQALGCETAILVGHSYGGNIGYDQLPGLRRLRGLLTVGAPPISTMADAGQAFALDDIGLLFYAPTLNATQAGALARKFLLPEASGAQIAGVVADLARADGRFRTTLAAALSAGELADEVGQVATTPVPLAFAAGAADPLLRPAYFETLTAPSRWGPPLHLVPDAAHLPMLENPPAFNQLVRDFARAVGVLS